MNKLTLIEGTNKPKPNLFALYNKAMDKMSEQALQVIQNTNDEELEDRTIIKRLAYYAIKSFTTNPVLQNVDNILLRELVESYYTISNCYKLIISALTPNELMEIFPIEKRYDGYRYQTKDYFYTMDKLKKIGLDTPIGENIKDLLWCYTNSELFEFDVRAFELASRLYKEVNGVSIMEQWAIDNDVEAYTMKTDPQTGKEYLINSTGQTIRVRKRMPHYMKLVR